MAAVTNNLGHHQADLEQNQGHPPEIRQLGVVALILTYSSPDTLRLVVSAVLAQTTPVRGIVIVDNAGDPPVELEDLELPSDRFVSVHRAPVNKGPAGGWSIALKLFRDHCIGEWAWLLDDDAVPVQNCLELLLAAAREENSSFCRPIVTDVDSGAEWNNPSWCGPLITRSAIASCGVPLAELVWWAEDTEFMQVRLPKAGFGPTVVHGARVQHYGRRRMVKRSPAKLYYETRNGLWVRLYAKRQYRHPHFWWKIARIVPVKLVSALRSESPIHGLGAWALGVHDGLRGRLGFRFVLQPGPLRAAEKDIQ